jgi:hypothetical protein
MITIDEVRRLACGLPGMVERPSYGGRPSWRAGPRMFAWVREKPEALVLWVESVQDKHVLIASAPDRFFTTGHYDGHPIVLVDLTTIDVAEAGELIVDSWRARAPKKLVTQFDQDLKGARSPWNMPLSWSTSTETSRTGTQPPNGSLVTPEPTWSADRST